MFLEKDRGVQQILRKYLKDKTFVLKKYHILEISLIYCGGRNREKINFLFDCFKKDDGKLINSDEFKEFARLKQRFMARDNHGQLVFLADSAFTIHMTQEKFPNVKLHFISEWNNAK